MSKHTPECPACGAKFSHDARTHTCNKCGLPDEFVSIEDPAERGRMIARWRKRELRQGGATKRPAKKVLANRKAGSRMKRRKEHGRS